MTKTPQRLEKIAIQARKNFAAGQSKITKAIVSVGNSSERLVSTCAGETRVITYISCEQSEPVPVFVNMHGGGFIMGSAENDDFWCRRVANAVPCLVVNIDYRLAPEHKFPAALEECYHVVNYLYSNAAKLRIDRARIAVGGQSAGANLAAGLCLLARDRRDFPIIYQVLNYPPLDMTIDPYSKSNLDKILTARMQILFTACYLRNEGDALNPLASPLLAHLAGLPDALMITAELDPLRPEAEQYVKRLAAAGVNATCKLFAGCMHAFTHFGPEAAASAALSLTCEQLKAAFQRS